MDFICTVNNCGEKFYEKKRLTEHVNRFHKDRVLACSYCEQKFRTYSEVKQHENDNHTGKIWRCRTCPYATKKKSNLITHMQNKKRKKKKSRPIAVPVVQIQKRVSAVTRKTPQKKSRPSKPAKKPKTTVSAGTFKKIRKNTYYGITAFVDKDMEDECKCQGTLKCYDDYCENRRTFVECTSKCGDGCQNRRIQKREGGGKKVVKFNATDKGFGVKATELIKEGEFILEYLGEVVSEAEYVRRLSTIYAGDSHHYSMELEHGVVIDAHRKGGDCRYVNRSCQPNCEIQMWWINKIARMALFARRDISTGEELTYDYKFDTFNSGTKKVCLCGSDNCRGYV